MFIVALQTCSPQVEQSVNLLKLLSDIARINPWPDDTELWVVYNHNVTNSDLVKIRTSSNGLNFTRIFPSIDNRVGWPIGPNYCWKTILAKSNEYAGFRKHVGVFCIEPDCIPLSSNWLHDVRNAWESTEKHILGHVEGENGRHINGNAVYDAKLFGMCPEASDFKISSMFPHGMAFDFGNAALFCSIGHDTNLIYQDYHLNKVTKDYFDSVKKNGQRPVWFHGSKTSHGLDIARNSIFSDAQLFIRTWERDLDWLKVCLQSVKMFWKSSLGTTIVATPACKGILSGTGFKELLESVKADVHYEPQNSDTRRGSVHIGLNMDKYTDADMVCNIDSDCVFTRPSNTMDFTKNGAPIIWMESFQELYRTRPGDSYAWDGYRMTIKDCLGYDSDLEFMQRHPFLYYTSSIWEVRNEIENRAGVPLIKVMERYASNLFSEFNLTGAYEHMRRKENKYYFMFKNELHGEERVHQFHSWSQTPESKRSEIERYLCLEQ